MRPTVVIIALCALLMPFVAEAKKEKDSDKQIKAAKVWFKDGKVYEGPLVKHWWTYRQHFTGSGHNFHALPDPDGKSVKYEASDVDSILIIDSTHPDFESGTMYVSMTDGRVPMNGPRKTNKMLRRVSAGQNVDFCKLPFMGNCQIGLRNQDQFMEYWLIRFHKSGKSFVFFENPLAKGCNKADERIEYFCRMVKDFDSGLADAVTAKFAPDKATRKNMKKKLADDPQLFVDFIDNYLSEHPE